MKYITFRKSDGRYVGRRTIKKVSFLVYGKTQRECQKNLNESISNYYKGLHKTKKETKTIKFIDYFNKWFENDKKPFITLDTQKDILRVKSRTEELHNIAITKIDKDTLVNYLNKQENNRTKEKIILYLKAVFKSAHADNVIKLNPFGNLKTAPRKIKTKPAFTFEEQTRIIQALKGTELEKVILIYLITGLRKNELNFKNIDKEIDFKTRILKTRNLKARNFEIRYKQIKLSINAIALIKNNIDIIRKYDSESCYREFAELLKKLNINGSIVTCRHTFATNCFYLGKPELLISREMGHRTSTITKEVYTDIDYNLSKEKIIKLYNNLYNLD